MTKPPPIRFRIDFDNGSNVGPGKIALLESIHQTGSLSAAARALGMSYRRAWLLLESLNTSFDEPTTLNTAGGTGGGGAKVTEFGQLLVQRYRELDDKIRDGSADCLKDILPHLAAPLPVAAKRRRTSLKPRRR